MPDRPVEEARLLPVGEHECVTCERCALTFARVHPACPRCAAERRAGELREIGTALVDALEAKEWALVAGHALRWREALQ